MSFLKYNSMDHEIKTHHFLTKPNPNLIFNGVSLVLSLLMMVTKTFLCTSSKKVQPAAIIFVAPIRNGVLNRCIPHIHQICRKQTLALKTGDWEILF